MVNVYFNVTNSTDDIFWYNDTNFSIDGQESTVVRITKVVAFCVLFLISLFGNVSVILAVSKDKRLKSTTNILVANMAVSDIIITFLEIPKTISNLVIIHDGWLVRGDFGQALCKLLPFLTDVSFAISIYSCVFIAIDRYFAIARPLDRGFSKERLCYIIPGIWIFACLICSPFLYSYQLVKTADKLTYCEEVWSEGEVATFFKVHFFVFLFLTTFIPILGITVLYLLIVYKIRNRRIPGVCMESERIRRDRENKKVLKMSITIITLLSVCWLFFEILNILETFTSVISDLPSLVRSPLLFAAIFILLTSCTHQFFIFLIFVDIYRQNFKILFTRCFCPCRRSRRVRPQIVTGSNNTQSTETTLHGQHDQKFETDFV